MARRKHHCPRKRCKASFETAKGVKIHVARKHLRKNTTAKKGKALASHLVEGKTLPEAAAAAGVSRATLCQWLKDYREGRLQVDDFLTAYRARLLPELADLQAKCIRRSLLVVGKESSVLKVTLAAKAAGEMLSKAAGEADLTFEMDNTAGAKARIMEALKRRRDAGDESETVDA